MGNFLAQDLVLSIKTPYWETPVKYMADNAYRIAVMLLE